MKRCFFQIVLWISYITGLFRLFAFLNRHNIVILAYHGVTNNRKNDGIKNAQGNHIYIKKFERQIKYLSKKYNFIPLEALIESIKKQAKLPAYSAVITMDDGYKNNYTNAFPIFKKYNVPAAIFLTTNLIGTNNLLWRDKIEYAIDNTSIEEFVSDINEKRYNYNLKGQKNKSATEKHLRNLIKTLTEEEKSKVIKQIIKALGVDADDVNNVDEDYKLLNWDEVKQMQKAGIRFGSHTENHIILTRVSKNKANEEVIKSKEKIQRKLGENIEFFSYPNGTKDDFNAEIKQMLKDLNFSCAVSLIYGMNDLNTDLYELKRIGVNNNNTFVNFLANLSGFTLFWMRFKQ
jgi:peptidoglycan/xylan/chitin deacetylase (PgdA/CDA1 family)